MQFTLINANPEALNEVNGTLLVPTQHTFYSNLLEELAKRHRVSLIGHETPEKPENFEESDDEQADELSDISTMTAMVELLLGECPEDRTEEEHEATIEAMAENLLGLQNRLIDGFFANEINKDQLNILADVDWTTIKELTWQTSENGGLTFILK